MADTGWRKTLAEQRRQEGLTQAEFAKLAGVSLGALKAYEQGLRDPSREVLTSLMDALKLDRGTRNSVLNAAGFVGDSALLSPSRHPDYHFSLAQSVRELDAHPWPAAVVSELMEVLGANKLLQRVWNVDLATELNTPVERNILSVIANPRFEGRLLNWDEVVGVAVAVVKGHYLGPETAPEGSSAYFAAVMQHFLSGVPAYVTRLAEIWEKTPAMTPKVRWTCPVRWSDPVAGEMRFHAIMSDANEPEGRAFMDWLPLDAATWAALEKLRQSGRRR